MCDMGNRNASRYIRQLSIVIVFFLAARIILRNLLALNHLQNRTQQGVQMDVPIDSKTQMFIDYLSHNLNVTYEVVDNLASNTSVKVRFTLSNTGQTHIHNAAWQLYFHNFRMMEKNRMAASGGSIVLQEYGLRLTHVNGGLFRMEPTESFKAVPPGGELVMSLEAGYWAIGRYDFMPNWYVVASGAEPRILECTRSEALTFIAPFDNPNKWKRTKNDQYNPYSPQQRYDLNVVEDLGRIGQPVIPTPASITLSEADRIKIDPASWIIISEHGLRVEAEYLSERIQIPLGHDVRMAQKNYIHVQRASVVVDGTRQPNSVEGYRLEVNPSSKHILVTGTSSAGIFYAIQTLLSLIDTYGMNLPKLLVTDAPRYAYRGFMIDVARNFFNVTEIKKILDAMAMYKMNKLHLHLTDDEGWRIEIPGLPELTEVGARRGHDPSETQCIMPCLGSGPFATGLGCGYYSVEDYREILEYAKVRHIEVIPEVDMPGHSNAAIKSMRARYLRYKDSDLQKAREYLLHDRQETSSYMSGQLYKLNSINPCMPSSYRFVDHVIKALVQLHAGIQPLRTFHLGGDEVPATAWQSSVACTQNEQLSNVDNLKEYFVQRVIQIASSHKLRVQGWEDAFYSKDNELFDHSKLGNVANNQVIANVWMNHFHGKKTHRAHEMANNGFNVVLSSGTHLYFDHHHEPDPEERGLYWAARFVDLKKVYSFMPENYYENVDVDKWGNSLSREEACRAMANCLQLQKTENVIGIQGQIWGETVRYPEQMEELSFPRIIAQAERAWHREEWEMEPDASKRNKLMSTTWKKFVNTMGYKELRRLEKLGIAYYLPVPGAKFEDGKLHINTAIPNVPIVASKDSGATWNDVSSGNRLQGDILLATRSFDSKHQSRPVKISVQ